MVSCILCNLRRDVSGINSGELSLSLSFTNSSSLYFLYISLSLLFCTFLYLSFFFVCKRLPFSPLRKTGCRFASCHILPSCPPSTDFNLRMQRDEREEHDMTIHHRFQYSYWNLWVIWWPDLFTSKRLVIFDCLREWCTGCALVILVIVAARAKLNYSDGL